MKKTINVIKKEWLFVETQLNARMNGILDCKKKNDVQMLRTLCINVFACAIQYKYNVE